MHTPQIKKAAEAAASDNYIGALPYAGITRIRYEGSRSSRSQSKLPQLCVKLDDCPISVNPFMGQALSMLQYFFLFLACYIEFVVYFWHCASRCVFNSYPAFSGDFAKWLKNVISKDIKIG